MEYICTYVPQDNPELRRTFHAVNKAAMLSWLTAMDRGDGSLHLDVYAGSLSDDPTLEIIDGNKVYEFLTGGQRCLRLPIPSPARSSSATGSSAGRSWSGWAFVKRCPWMGWLARWM